MRATGAPIAAFRLAAGREVPPHLRAALGQHFFDIAMGVETYSIRNMLERADRLEEPARAGLLALFDRYEGLGTRVSALGLPLMVAYDLNVRDWDTLLAVYESTLAGCLHAVALDAIVDTSADEELAPLRDLYLVHLLFDWQIETLTRVCHESWSDHGFQFFLNIEYQIYGALFEEELLHTGVSNEFVDGHILAAKCGALKTVMSEVVYAAERPDLLPVIGEVVDKASYAMCLLDDIWDWEEDLARHRYTFPIQRALERMEIPNPEVIFGELPSRVRRGLFVGGVVHELILDIRDNLRACQLLVRPVSAKAELWLWLAEQNALSYWDAVLEQLLRLRPEQIND